VTNTDTTTLSFEALSVFRGIYKRVADQLQVDPSYVSRVARGERQSDDIEASLERELKRIMALVKTGRNGASRNGAARKANKTKTQQKTQRLAAD
jgi:hypothetical protein